MPVALEDCAFSAGRGATSLGRQRILGGCARSYTQTRPPPPGSLNSLPPKPGTTTTSVPTAAPYLVCEAASGVARCREESGRYAACSRRSTTPNLAYRAALGGRDDPPSRIHGVRFLAGEALTSSSIARPQLSHPSKSEALSVGEIVTMARAEIRPGTKTGRTAAGRLHSDRPPAGREERLQPDQPTRSLRLGGTQAPTSARLKKSFAQHFICSSEPNR
jgi:hypothetical protein